jgi:hypothetical protein
MFFRPIALVVVPTALLYAALLMLNDYLFGSLWISPGETWVFLPSGWCLIAILLFEEWGALGIIVGSLAVLGVQGSGQDPLASIGAALISGLAPLAARQVCLELAQIDVQLKSLTAVGLLRVALIFSSLSAALQQCWFAWWSSAEHFFTELIVTLTANMAGAMLVLYACKLVLHSSAYLRKG